MIAFKYFVRFPENHPGGYGGTHEFATRRDRDAFMQRAVARGISVLEARLWGAKK